jgi:hypothetical protein
MNLLPLRVESGHLVTYAEDTRWLLDTGSPLSFGRAAFRAGEHRHAVARTLMTMDADELCRLSGCRVDGLLGMDILGAFDAVIDVPAGVLELHAGALPFAADSMEMETVMGVPILEACIDGRTERAFLDTGAPLSYVPAECCENRPSLGWYRDFLPMMGEFDTGTWRLDVEAAGVRQPLLCGVLPPMMAAVLPLSGARAILGNELFAGQRVALSARQGRLAILASTGVH